MYRKFLVFFPFLLSLSILSFAEPASSSPSIPNKAVTPTARTCPEMNGIYFTGDFIYWKAREDELYYAAFLDFNQTPNEIDQGYKVVEIDFEYDPGFKVGLGGNLPYDGWDIYLNWTHFHTHPTSSSSSSDRNIVALFAESSITTTDFVGDRASVSWNLMFNTLDLDWGRRFYLSRTLTVRPSFGGKAAWIHQRIRSKLTGVEERGAVPPIAIEDHFFHWISKFWGVGPYLAINGKWTFIWGLGLYGEISGAILWGQFNQNVHYVKRITDEQTGQPVVVNDRLRFNPHRVRPTLKAFVGLDWERCIIKKWLSLNFRIGYETQYFWSQLVNNNTNQASSAADLTFEGLTFTGRLDF